MDHSLLMFGSNLHKKLFLSLNVEEKVKHLIYLLTINTAQSRLSSSRKYMKSFHLNFI